MHQVMMNLVVLVQVKILIAIMNLPRKSAEEMVRRSRVISETNQLDKKIML